MDNEALQKGARQDLAEFLVINLAEQVQQKRAEPVRVRVRVAEVHNDGAEEMVLTWAGSQM